MLMHTWLRPELISWVEEPATQRNCEMISNKRKEQNRTEQMNCEECTNKSKLKQKPCTHTCAAIIMEQQQQQQKRQN